MRLIKGKNYFTNKKINISFILSIMVVSLHYNPFAEFHLLENRFGRISLYIIDLWQTIASLAVPMFFVISGAMFYRGFQLSMGKEKIKRRITSLLIPYLIWCTVNMIFTYTTSLVGVKEELVITVSDVLQGIFLHKYGPLWFVLYIMVFSLLYPVIFFLIRTKRRGILSILLVYILCVCEARFRIISSLNPEYEPEAILYYLVGAYLGRYHFSAFSVRQSRRNYIFADFICVISVVFAYMLKVNPAFQNIPRVIYPLVTIVMCLSFWVGFDCFANTGYFEFASYSFLVYTMHMMVIHVLHWIFKVVFPRTPYFVLADYVTVVCMTAAVCCVCAHCLRKLFPKVYKIVAGRE